MTAVKFIQISLFYGNKKGYNIKIKYHKTLMQIFLDMHLDEKFVLVDFYHVQLILLLP